MIRKIRVGILFGGKSAEHEVSLQSARNIIDALDREKYEPVPIGIDKQGRWRLNESSTFVLNAENPKLIRLNSTGPGVALTPGESERQLVAVTRDGRRDENSPSGVVADIDVVFPVLHGPLGEDGAVQGMLKLANIPFVGADVLGSAIGMDKDVMKRLLRDARIPVADFIAITRTTATRISSTDIIARLGLPCFVKPANLGSSVGISKVGNESELRHAIEAAFAYDNKVIVEEYIRGREIECSVLGADDPIASIPGEILPHHDFYSYEAKYIDEHGAAVEIPARLPAHIVERIQRMAVDAFSVLCCEGMARVDFFLRDDDELLVNEINTIPGFTNISMYPKLWEASGISYSDLIDQLIHLALERHERDRRLRTTYE